MTVTPEQTGTGEGTTVPAAAPAAEDAVPAGEAAARATAATEEAAAKGTVPTGETAAATTVPAAPGANRSGTPGTRSAPGGSAPADAPVTRGFLARAALVTAVCSAAGALLGLVRDLSLARMFGAGSETDAFLVAWTVPEFAATLLIEDGLAIALIPAFSMALARRAQGAGGDPVRSLVAGTLPRLSLAFAAVAALLAVCAPQLVRVLAPGLPDPALAVDCTRLTATCVLTFGLAGYCSAALRAHRRFLAPAAIYVAYNTGIITAVLVLGGRWGVRAAAVGVAAGGCLMVLVQLPVMWRELRRGRDAGPAGAVGRADGGGRPMGLALLAAVLLFALCRQSQVLIERFLGSTLPAGAISHLNYAQKVAQIPMTLSLMLCTVTFPVVARALADGDTERARARVERDLALAACLVLAGGAVVVACAPQLVELLFQRGAFTAEDTTATVRVMRVYALGLLAQTLVGALIRSYFSAGRVTWYPLGAMAAGLVVTAGAGAWAVDPWGVIGIAAANAAGITVTAALLLAGMGPRSVPVRTRRVLAGLGRPLAAAAAATAAGAWVTSRLGSPASSGPTDLAGSTGSPLFALAAGALTVAVVFLTLGRALGDQGCRTALTSLRSVSRRLPHGRSR
ncbi:murein biosynthesis integral membrane protein MurJ [Streptomyces dubilierae]|uniref:Lipid II flippase MurJ n=1 Tax=Streptomyces dubilierae TaxID=3075533 RepID=A0ABU2PHE7_9ACTN|nr:lipid II flippase MurJ [Streptomyces sp. DSM 41921]MDT0391252.1 lipid II flippase MurJ [Streptomyces sp. DSM 41921]